MTPSPVIVSFGKNVNVRDKNGKVQPRKWCDACGHVLVCLGRKLCLTCYRAHFAEEARRQSATRVFDGIPCRSIPLTRGYVAWVDEARFEDVARWKWVAIVAPHTVYASRRRDKNERETSGKTALRMHRYLKGDPEGMVVDHRDGDGLHNWEANLRTATQAQNSRNQKAKPNKAKYRGVTFSRKTGKYVAQIGYAGKHFNLGHFDTPEEASAVYDRKSLELHGEFSPCHREV